MSDPPPGRKPMSDLQAVLDRVELETLRGAFTAAAMMRDYDRYQRTPDGWKFTERVYEVRYVDTTPLAGVAPQAGRERSSA